MTRSGMNWRDIHEGGNVIMWLNDIEKDTRYSSWPSALQALLQRGYPGQLPSVRRDIHNVVLPVDLANGKDLVLIVETIQSFIKRNVPVRWGLVPSLATTVSTDYAKISYHVLETYGLSTLLGYYRSLMASKKTSPISSTIFMKAIQDRELRPEKNPVSLADVLTSSQLNARLESVQSYAQRLALAGDIAPVLINGCHHSSRRELA